MDLFDIAVARKLSGGSGGGGGSSDFSTAEVTWVVTGGASATIYDLIFIMSGDGGRYFQYVSEVPNPPNGTITVPLIDGYTSFGLTPNTGGISVSGAGDYDVAGENVRITGDITITLS